MDQRLITGAQPSPVYLDHDLPRSWFLRHGHARDWRCSIITITLLHCRSLLLGKIAHVDDCWSLVLESLCKASDLWLRESALAALLALYYSSSQLDPAELATLWTTGSLCDAFGDLTGLRRTGGGVPARNPRIWAFSRSQLRYIGT